MGNKYLIAYYVETLNNNTIKITNSMNQSVTSNDYKELMDFLYTPYKEIDGRELKFFYNLDESVAQIFRIMPHDLCKRLLNKNFDDTLKEHEPYYYHAGHNFIIFGNHKVGNIDYRAHFYSLDNLIESETELTNAQEIYELSQKLLKALNNIGINFPLSLNSMIGIFESSMGHIRLTPNTSFVPPEYIDLITYARLTSKRQGWVCNHKVGKFDHPYSYDLASAYGYHLSQVRNYNRCDIYPYSKDFKYKKEAWNCLETGDITGWFQTELTIFPHVKVHPFGYKDETTGRMTYKTGTFPLYMLLDEIVYVYKKNIGTVKIIDGFYVKFSTRSKPMEKWVNDLFNKRQLGEVENKLCKSLIVQYVGKTLTEYGNDRTSKIYNPMLASWVYAKCRLQVFDFILDNHLENDVVAITTDGVLSTKPALVTKIETEKILGTWRENKPSPAIVLSPGWILTQEKHPHNFDYDKAIELMELDPHNNYYAIKYDAMTTLFDAIEHNNDIRTVGKIKKNVSTIDLLELRFLQNKEFNEYPMTGKDILSNKIYE